MPSASVVSPAPSLVSASPASASTLSTPTFSMNNSPTPGIPTASSYPVVGQTHLQIHQPYYQNTWSPATQIHHGPPSSHTDTLHSQNQSQSISLSGRQDKGWSLDDDGHRGLGGPLSIWVKEEPEDISMDEENESGRMGEHGTDPKGSYDELWMNGDFIENNGYWRFSDMRSAVVESHSARRW